MIIKKDLKEGMVFKIKSKSNINIFKIGEKIKLVKPNSVLWGEKSIFTGCAENYVRAESLETGIFQYIPIQDLQVIKTSIKKL